VDVPQCSTHPKGRRRPPLLDASQVSSSLGAWQVPLAVFVEAAPQEARTERAEQSADRGYRRTQNTQSSFRLSTDRTHHFADIRYRHRQERGVPRAGETLSSGSGRNPGLPGWRSSATPPTAAGAWSCFDASRSSSGVTGCSWSWTSSRVASLA